MDIIASHRQGLFELLQAEALALAGTPRDSTQRAMVYHHLADSLGLAHVYALLAAEAALAIGPAIEQIERAARGSWWRLSGDRREALLERVERFGEALRSLDATRCAGALLAYRLVATPGLTGEAQERLSPGLSAALEASRSARGATSAEARRALFLAHQHWAEEMIGNALEQAIIELDWPLGANPVSAAIGLLRIATPAYERAEARGLASVERRLRASRALPAAFAANPAQAFYALQRHLAERRRNPVGEAAGVALDEAVRLAA